MYVIAIDVGSSYIKSALFEMDSGELVVKQQIQMVAKQEMADPKIFEVNADQIYQTVQTIIDGYQTRYDAIEGIVFSTQMHGVVLSEGAREDDVYISWQDTRSLATVSGAETTYINQLETLFSKGEMTNTGVYIKPALALCNLYTYYAKKNFNILKGTTLYTLGSYLIERLTGRNICHVSNGAPLGFLDIQTGTWRRDLLEKAGLSGLILPEVTGELTCCGMYSKGRYPIKVYPDIGDTQATVLGCPVKAGDVVINIGTAGQILYVEEGFNPGNYETRPFFENLHLNVISSMPSGRNLDVQIDYLREAGNRIFNCDMSREAIWGKILKELSLDETQGLKVDASFYELPDNGASGGIFNIDRSNFTIDHVVAATLLDIGKIYLRYFDLLSNPKEFEGRCYFCGGAAMKNPMLVKAITREIQLKTVVPPRGDEVYHGMYRVALLCTERCERLEEAIERELKIKCIQ